jgi:PAS domain S-box-containing protein
VSDAQTHQLIIANRAICDMLGYTMEEMYRLGLADIHPAEALAGVQKTFERQLKGEIRMAQNMPVKRKDGSVFFADVSASPIVLEGRTYLVGAFHDVTERRQAEERIRDSEARYRSIFEYANDVIILLNADGTFRSISPSGERITGWKAEEWTGKPFTSLVHADDLADAGAAFQKALAGESISSLRLRIATKSGEYFSADVSVTPLGHDLIMGIVRDVSERQRAEAEIRTLNEELESKVQERTRQLLEAQEDLVRKEKLAVLGQVAGSVGHELRNPLGVMNNAVYFLQTVLSDADETIKEYLNIIKDEIADSERIVSDLLDSVRTKPPRPEAVGVAELIGQTLNKLTLPATVTVSLDIPQTLSQLQVDAQQIQQVFRNLISNGVEAMPEGGELEIRAVENKPEGQVVVSVRDTGSGIAPDILPRLFQPLFTTKARGIGLGLVVVKNLTQANGGEIAVQSEVGQGTTFTVTLPAARSFDEED